MTSATAKRIGAACAALLASAALSGCQRTLFEQAPAPAQACDPALVGRWLSVADDNASDGELEALLDPDCELVVIEHKQDGPRRSEPTRLHNARVGGIRYLWLDASWANRSFEVEPNLLDREGDVYLLAYRVRRDVLQIVMPPHRSLAHRVLDKDIEGEVLAHEHELTVRIGGNADEIRASLRKYRVFRFDKAMRLRRSSDETSP